jgi:hypothetical protein
MRWPAHESSGGQSRLDTVVVLAISDSISSSHKKTPIGVKAGVAQTVFLFVFNHEVPNPIGRSGQCVGRRTNLQGDNLGWIQPSHPISMVVLAISDSISSSHKKTPIGVKAGVAQTVFLFQEAMKYSVPLQAEIRREIVASSPTCCSRRVGI